MMVERYYGVHFSLVCQAFCLRHNIISRRWKGDRHLKEVNRDPIEERRDQCYNDTTSHRVLTSLRLQAKS